MGIKRIQSVRKGRIYSITLLLFFSLLFSSCTSTTVTNKRAIQGLLDQGQIYLFDELYSEAISTYKEILSIDEDNIEGLYGLAQAHLLSKNLIKSGEVILTLSKVDTTHSYSLTKTYATLLYDGGEKEKALAQFYQLYLTNEYDKDLGMMLIEKYLENENFDLAMEVAMKLYQYHFNDAALIKKIADVAELGNFPHQESWAVLAQ